MRGNGMLLLLAVLMAAMCSCGGCGCTPGLQDPEGLDTGIAKQIKQTYLKEFLSDYPKATVKDAWIVKYYGTYNGCVVVMMGDNYTGYTDALWGMEVAGVAFKFKDGNSIRAWKDGKFYTLQAAYEQGLLTQEDLTNIADIHEKNY